MIEIIRSVMSSTDLFGSILNLTNKMIALVNRVFSQFGGIHHAPQPVFWLRQQQERRLAKPIRLLSGFIKNIP
jgi:hypothetical protein